MSLGTNCRATYAVKITIPPRTEEDERGMGGHAGAQQKLYVDSAAGGLCYNSSATTCHVDKQTNFEDDIDDEQKR